MSALFWIRCHIHWSFYDGFQWSHFPLQYLLLSAIIFTSITLIFTSNFSYFHKLFFTTNFFLLPKTFFSLPTFFFTSKLFFTSNFLFYFRKSFYFHFCFYFHKYSFAQKMKFSTKDFLSKCDAPLERNKPHTYLILFVFLLKLQVALNTLVQSHSNSS